MFDAKWLEIPASLWLLEGGISIYSRVELPTIDTASFPQTIPIPIEIRGDAASEPPSANA